MKKHFALIRFATFGLVFLSMLFFTGCDQIADIVADGKRPETIDRVDDEEMRDLIIECWLQEPLRRPSIEIISQRLEKIWNHTF